MKKTTLARSLGWAGAALAGCLPSLPPSSPRTPERWIVVERRLGDVLQDGRGGDGRVDPGASVLTMQPLSRNGPPGMRLAETPDPRVEILETSPSGPASPGETVTATVHVAGAGSGEVYRLVARALRPDVRLIGANEQVVQGGEPVRFRFTSLSSGPGAISIEAKRMGSQDRRLP